MDRFVAMLWDKGEQQQNTVERWSDDLRLRDGRWTRVLDLAGLRVFALAQDANGPIVTPWDGEDGVHVGRLFSRGHERLGRLTRLASDEAARARASGGASLVADYWGNYLAFWRDQVSGQTHVLRDPCGAVPCFMTQQRGIDLFFAHAEDVATLWGLSFSIDWTFLRAFVHFNYFVTEHTGLQEVKELLGGECFVRAPGGKTTRHFLWNGAKIAAEPSAQSFEDAAAELRETAEACFAAWGSSYAHVVVSLSGGLDSSVLVNLLARASTTNITGIHYLGVDYEQYEVKLARLAAERAGIKLIEAVQDPAKDEVWRILDAPRLARPKVQSIAVLIDDLSEQLARRVGGDCFMIGQGGDNLFLQSGGAQNTLADYVRLRGLGRDFWRVAYESAMMQQKPVWGVLGKGLAKGLAHSAWDPFAFLKNEEWTKHSPFAANAVDAIPDSYKQHPWFGEARFLPRDKADHLNAIVGLYNYYTDHGRGLARDVVHPLFSQPITELVLRTPTYLLTHSGLDRALERHAFADLLPDEIRLRTAKSGADHYLLQVMENNFDLYRELVLDGELVKQNWLDRAKIEHMVDRSYAANGGGALFIYLLVAVEAWLNTWGQRGLRKAA